jgi:hypothetical protein
LLTKIELIKTFQFHNTPIQLIEKEGKTFVYDPLRKKKIQLTPEEEVRQKLLWYFIYEKQIPAGLIAIERALKINGMLKRFDMVIYNQLGNPFMAIECKAPSIKLTQNTLQQLATYNLHLKAEFLMVSNGMEHLMSQVNFETREIRFLEELPF